MSCAISVACVMHLQIEDLMQSYPNVPLAVINQSQVEAIAGELNIFTVPVDLIFMNGKEMHRQGRLSICNVLNIILSK